MAVLKTFTTIDKVEVRTVGDLQTVILTCSNGTEVAEFSLDGALTSSRPV